MPSGFFAASRDRVEALTKAQGPTLNHSVSFDGPALPSWEDLCRASQNDAGAFAGELAALKRQPPALLRIAQFIVRTAMRDPSYRKFLEFSWADLVDLLAEQVAWNRNFRCCTPEEAALEPVSGCHAKAVHRPFNQLPCTRMTALWRVAQAQKLCSPDAPLLLLGDDDMVSLELARAGFRNVTAVDIDMKVIEAIAAEARRERLPVTLFHHDLSEEPPRDLPGPYELVFIDPMYSLPGIELFLQAALKICQGKPRILLSVHLLSLLRSGLKELGSVFTRLGFEVVNVRPGANAYPVPDRLRYLLWLLNTFVLRSKALQAEGRAFPFFTSDAILLQKS